MTKEHRRTGLVLAVVAFALDQSSKALALASASELSGSIQVLPFFNLVLVRNPGVSFGLLGFTPWWALTAFGFVMVAALGIWLWRSQSRLLASALGLVIGGALGNVLDRVRQGAVTDFLDVHVADYHWPAFNLADVAIVIGAALLLLDSVKSAQASAPRR